ncbi:MAG TPA: glutamate racemase, partial [Agitococcus sp.]|nr:glutamate racemase [Agitococcus sp.]
RTPYGTRSFETVYQFTLESVRYLFNAGCPLVILACNTASAKALRSIQQQDLPLIDASRRVLGVIRPSVEQVGLLTKTGHVGVLGTTGTVTSDSYRIEIQKIFPHVQVFQQACPMWVPLVENGEYQGAGADFFVQRDLQLLFAQSPQQIDTIILGCTHYPLLIEKIKSYLPTHVKLLSQGEIVAQSLADYLVRHSTMAQRCSAFGSRTFLTTDNAQTFNQHAAVFLGQAVESQKVMVF